MSLKLWLSARTPYATRPSSIGFQLRIANLGAESVRGPEPDAMCIETLDERGERLSYVPCGPSPHAPRELDVPPQSFHTLINLSSRASGSIGDIGVYEARCLWQNATSNLLRYRVIADRRAFVVTMRAVSATAIEVILVNHDSGPIEWPQACSEQDLTLWAADGTRVETVLSDDTEVTEVLPGAMAVLRFEVPGGSPGVKLDGHFVREPFASGTVTLVL
jgi:hypothetical protein